jgi:hypothetical protein
MAAVGWPVGRTRLRPNYNDVVHQSPSETDNDRFLPLSPPTTGGTLSSLTTHNSFLNDPQLRMKHVRTAQGRDDIPVHQTIVVNMKMHLQQAQLQRSVSAHLTKHICITLCQVTQCIMQ